MAVPSDRYLKPRSCQWPFKNLSVAPKNPFKSCHQIATFYVTRQVNGFLHFNMYRVRVLFQILLAAASVITFQLTHSHVKNKYPMPAFLIWMSPNLK